MLFRSELSVSVDRDCADQYDGINDSDHDGILVEVKGYLKPNEWKNAEGESRHRIILAARSVKPIAKPASMMEPQPEAIAS